MPARNILIRVKLSIQCFEEPAKFHNATFGELWDLRNILWSWKRTVFHGRAAIAQGFCGRH